MSRALRSTILGYLHRIVGAPESAGVPDADLLRRFVTGRDEAAFELLLWRHGTMVLNLCRRLLRDSHAAEDAFQATFLVLVRRAGSVRKRDSLASWLYQVAYRLALKARSRSARRAAVESPELNLSEVASPGTEDAAGRELRRLLCEEVNRLPAKYRAVVVLCYFEARTHEEAARELAWAKGTVAGRLARARELLRRRLTRRGVTLTAATLAALLAPDAAGAAGLEALVPSTIQAARLFAAGNAAAASGAAALAEGVLKAMFWTRLKIATTLLLGVAFIGAGTATLIGRTPRAPQPGAGADSGPGEAPGAGAGAPPGGGSGAGAERQAEDRLQFARRLAQSRNNLKQIALAMHNYNDVYGHLPAPALYEGEGAAGGAMRPGMGGPGGMPGMPGVGNRPGGKGAMSGPPAGSGMAGGPPGMGGAGGPGGLMMPGAPGGRGKPGGGAMPGGGRGMPGNVRGPDGKALLSWRVALLPFLEQDALYRAFHLNEPWDSPHNSKLLKQMPKVYAPPGVKTRQPYLTYYQLFVGKDAPFQKHRKAWIPASFPDGTSNTILIAEAGNAVPWTKPVDLPYAADEPLPELGGLFANVFNVALADGSVQTLKKNCDQQQLRWAIESNDGQPIDWKKLKATTAERLADLVGTDQMQLEASNRDLQQKLARAREELETLKTERQLRDEIAREKARQGLDATDPLAKENARLQQTLRQVQDEIGRLKEEVRRQREGRPGRRPAEKDPLHGELDRLRQRLAEEARRHQAENERLRAEIERLQQLLEKRPKPDSNP